MSERVYRGTFINQPVAGKSNKSVLNTVHKTGTGQVFIFDKLGSGQEHKLWLDSRTALKLATWILDNVSEN